MKSIIEYINKILDFRFQLSVFTVMCGLLYLDFLGVFSLNEPFRYLVFFFLLSSSIALIFLIIDKLFYLIKEFCKNYAKRRADAKEEKRIKDGMSDAIYQLDVFELNILVKLRAVNHIRIKTSPHVFSLSKRGMIKIVSSGSGSCSVKLSKIAHQTFNDVLWPKIEEINYLASIRLFQYIDIGELRFFRPFLENELFIVKASGYSNVRPPSYRVFSKYNDSSVFSDGQSHGSFRMVEPARTALIETFYTRISDR